MPQELKDRIVWGVVGGILSIFLFTLTQIAWHGVTKAYAVEKDFGGRVTKIETVLPRLEKNMEDGFKKGHEGMKELKLLIKEFYVKK